WMRRKDVDHRTRRVLINGLGAIGTGVVLIIVISTKLVHGAWIVILLIPAFVFGFGRVRRHYSAVAQQLSLEGLVPDEWTDVTNRCYYRVVVPVSGMHRGVLPALHFALSLSADVTAVVVDVDPTATERVVSKWPIWGHGIPLQVLESPFRSTVGPFLDFLEPTSEPDARNEPIVVVLPEFIPARWWHRLLHNQTALLLRSTLLYRRRQASRDWVIVNVPYYLRQ
ncbi:MAG: amino acid permease, partial [Chloroflexi bacterium]|nr:amino acid permease [Chloroflexota bacterium]